MIEPVIDFLSTYSKQIIYVIIIAVVILLPYEGTLYSLDGSSTSSKRSGNRRR